MKRWIALVKRGVVLVLAAALALWQLPTQAQVQPRVFSQPELEALLAPVALYPDPVLSNILVATTYPEDVRAAAAWSRANPQLTGEDAVRAAEPIPWHPGVKALLAFPDLLARMDESPQWTEELGEAFREQEPYVMDAVQNLRRRAQASGSLQSNDQYSVQQQGSSIAVYPAQPQVVYVPYYDPNVVYGTWFWPAYRPVFWRPWFTHPTVFVSTTTFFVRSVDWQRRHVVRPVPHQQATVQGPHGWQWAGQRRNDLRADASVAGAAQRAAQRAAQAAGQPSVQPVPQNRPMPAQQNQAAQQRAEHQPRWREQQQQHWREQQQSRAQQRPEARTPHMNPSAAPAPSTAHDPVRPIGQPVRPISNTVPTIHNQPRAAHPFIESVRPRFEQRSQYRQPGGRAGHPPQQRRQAGQPQQRRG
jgi:hypothetical protein